MPPATRSSRLRPPPTNDPRSDANIPEPGEFPCHHSAPCSCASPIRPPDASLYHNGAIRAPNRVTAAYIERNLRISEQDLIFASASFRHLLIALPDAVYRLAETAAATVSTTVHASHGWVIINDANDANITVPLLHACSEALARLNICGPVSAAHVSAFAQTPASHRAADGWTAIATAQVDLATGFVDLKTKRGRQFLCFLGSFLLALWTTEQRDEVGLALALARRTSAVHRYFLYLVWRDGYRAVPALSASKTAVFRELRQARALDAMRREMQGLAGAVEGVRGEVAVLGRRGELVETKLARVEEQAAENAADIHGLAETVEEGLCEVGTRVDQGLCNVEEGLYRVESKLGREVQDLDAIVERLDIVVDDRMRGLAGRIETAEDLREAFDERLQGVGQRLDMEVTMRKALDTRLDTTVQNLSTRLDAEETARKEMHERLDTEINTRAALDTRLDTEVDARMMLDNTVQTLSARLDTEVNSLGDSVAVLRESMLSSAALAEANSNQRHQDMMSFMQSLMTERTAEAPARLAPAPAPTVTFLLRLRGGNPRVSVVVEAQGSVLKVAGKRIPGSPGFRSIFTEQPNDVVTAAVVREVFTDPERFVLAVHGYSGHGKTHTVMHKDGLLEAILCKLTEHAGLKVTVREMLHDDLVVGEFLLAGAGGGGGDAIPAMIERIKLALRTELTPANAQSSRRHTVIQFASDRDPGTQYGMLVDVAGEETSRNRALLAPQMTQTSNVICADNAAFRKLLREYNQGSVSPVTKRSSKLNTRLVDFGGRMVVMVVADATDLEVLKKAVTI